MAHLDLSSFPESLVDRWSKFFWAFGLCFLFVDCVTCSGCSPRCWSWSWCHGWVQDLDQNTQEIVLAVIEVNNRPKILPECSLLVSRIPYSVINYMIQKISTISPDLAQKRSDAFEMVMIGQSSKELWSDLLAAAAADYMKYSMRQPHYVEAAW